MLVALTGGGGFVGRYLIDHLTRGGFRVRALQNRQPLTAHLPLDIVTGDLADQAALDRLMEGADAVIHAAGLVAARRNTDFQRVNAEGAANVAAAAVRQMVPRLLLISSLAARRPDLSPYAASKRAGEDAVAAAGLHGWDILRPPAVYGPGDLRILPLLQLLKRRIALLPAGKDGRAALLHADDLAAAATAWLRSGMATNGTYAIDDGTSGYKWRDILALAATQLGVAPVFFRPPALLLYIAAAAEHFSTAWQGVPPFLTRGKIAELRVSDWTADGTADFARLAGWQPRIALQAGLAATIDWYRDNVLL